MTHDFVVNTENVNEYGYRVITSGIDYKQYMKNPIVLFMHERDNFQNRGDEVIGRCLALKTVGTELIATVEFDEENEYAKKIAGKVERGFIRMASMYGDPKETSTEAHLVLEGQTYATVTKMKLRELSIVDIGGNDDALKLKQNAEKIKLELINKNNMSELKPFAQLLKLKDDATSVEITNEIVALRSRAENAETKASNLQNQLDTITLSQVNSLVDEAVSLGLFPEGMKDFQAKAISADFEKQQPILLGLIEARKAENGQTEVQGKLKEISLGSKIPSASQQTNETYDYLQRFNPVKLRDIHEKQPELYAKLADDYANGVRHSEK